ncbi:MAG: hypothetical protein ABII39_07540 [Candidatus Micrarchaeota archaeon]
MIKDEEYLENIDLNSLTNCKDNCQHQLLDKIDNKTCLYFPHNLESRWLVVTNILKQSKSKEIYIFFTHRFQKSSKDKRIPVLTIKHCWDYENSFMPRKEHRDIHFVLDPKNHSTTMPFHLNLSGQSKKFLSECNCNNCKKYFSSLNHFSLIYDSKEEYGSYKFSNLDKTLDALFKKIEENGFFTEFLYRV